MRESPSKAAKIVMKYINSYPDVGPLVQPTQITYKDLVDMAQTLDKKELWVRSDLRLIFSQGDNQVTDESIEQMIKILQN